MFWYSVSAALEATVLGDRLLEQNFIARDFFSLEHASILKMKVARPSEKSISTRVHGVTSQ
jgi:hypothetical protein